MSRSQGSATTDGDSQYLDNDEIEHFLNQIDHEDKGFIAYKDVEMKLDDFHDALFGEHRHRTQHHTPCPHCARLARDDDARHQFLSSMMGSSDSDRVARSDFAELLRSWKIPSVAQNGKQQNEDISYSHRLPRSSKIRAYWAVRRPELCFIALVVGLQLAFGIWQLVKYKRTLYRAALGWPLVMAKTCAGALYPTFFFLILSMSRYTSTWLRHSNHLFRFIEFDLSQQFHIYIACVAVLLATLHAIAHLTGTFVRAVKPEYRDAAAEILGSDSIPRSYAGFLRTIAGATGITGLGLLYILSLLSIPWVRRRNHEVFQLAHLLMFPIIGLMIAHGTAALLQRPLFGYFLAFPTLMVLVERVVRVIKGFHRIKATMSVLDEETLEIMADFPRHVFFKYKAGQYIFLQVPEISFFQWHPFTVSFCRDQRIMVHIKADGNWTRRLHRLGAHSYFTEIEIGIDGPFGAPTQRFFDFQHSIIVGTGIGVTPFSGVLADLQHNHDLDHGNHDVGFFESQDTQETVNKDSATILRQLRSKSISGDPTQRHAWLPKSPKDSLSIHDSDDSFRTSEKCARSDPTDANRRVQFHWTVRDRNHLLWFSDLLNQVSLGQKWNREHGKNQQLDIRIKTHVTAERKDLVFHVFRWLLERHRTAEHPNSPITGLLNPTHFGRPDFNKVIDNHYHDMLKLYARNVNGKNAFGNNGRNSDVKVGVFYYGSPVVGEILAEKCKEVTVRARHDGSRISYHFITEVFS